MSFEDFVKDQMKPKSGLVFPFSAQQSVLDGKRILLPGDIYKPKSRNQFIEEFLGEWLNERQMKGMAPYFRDMLSTYTVELLLYAQRFGIDKLLLDINDKSPPPKTYPLMLAKAVPEKPKKMKVEVEELGGDLAANTKTLLVSEIDNRQHLKNDDDICYGGCD
jgi:hypothetical protein